MAGAFIALVVLLAWIAAGRIQAKIQSDTGEALQTVLHATQESLLLLDRNGIILAVNQTAADRLGQDLENLVGTNRFDLLPEGVQERRKDIFSKVLQTGMPADFEDERNGIVFRSRYYPVTGLLLPF